MKSVWTMPKMHIQQFEANESIAACYDVKCTLYELHDHQDGEVWQGKDPEYDTWAASQRAGIWHSSDACGVAGNQVFRNGKMYELSKNHGELECTILGDPVGDHIEWENHFGRQKWHHVGIITLRDESRPNHS